MKKLLIPILALLIASPAWSAQQPQTVITPKNSREALRTAVNTEIGKIHSNTAEIYNLAIASPWLAQTTAPSITNVFWVDTSGTSPVIKYWDGDSWEVAAAGDGGTYTLPTASAETKGGVKIGARLTMTGEVLSADVQTTDISGKENSLGNPSTNGYVLSSTTGGTRSWIEMTGGGTGISHATSDGNYYASRNGGWANISTVFPTIANALVGDCTVGPCLDGTSDGGTTIKLYAGTGSYWTALQGGAPAANRSWRLPIAAAPSAGTTRLMNMDEYGQMGFVDPATFAPALGSDDNYVTDAEKTKLTNLSGTNSGDNAVNSNYASLVTNATHTGDVTGATALTIANSAVTLAKMANMATGSLIYRKTASSGAPEVNTLATLKTDLGLTGTNSGDQTATTTAFTPNGTIAATTVQAAIQEVRDEAGGSSTYPSANNLGWTTNGTSWSAMGLDTDISSTSASDDTVPSAKATKTALDLKANASSIAFEAATWADLKILDTTHTTAGTGIALVQDSMAYGNADDAYHLWSIDKVGSELAGKQAADADLTTYAGITPSANVQSLLGAATYAAMRTLLDLEAGTDFNAYDADIADLADGSLTGSKVGFADTDGLWTATNVQAALEEMNDSINSGVPNGTGAKVHWSQILGVPAGFADGSDDGAGGTPTAITVADTTDTTSYVALFESANGDLGPKTDAGLTYNAGTGMLTATGFTGPLTGTASGNLTTSSTSTLTNKTIDTAGTGNEITVPLNGVLDGAITDPADADDMIYKKVQNAMTLTDIHCLAEGGGTITLTLQECTSAGASCANIETAITCDADGAEDDGTLSDASIAAGAWIKVLYSAPTGTVNNVAWTVYGTQTW